MKKSTSIMLEMNELGDILQLDAPVGEEESQWQSAHAGDEQLIFDMDDMDLGRSSDDKETSKLSYDASRAPIIEDDEAEDSDSASGHLDTSVVIKDDVLPRVADEPPADCDHRRRPRKSIMRCSTSSQSLQSSLKSTSTSSTADLSSSTNSASATLRRKISFSSIEIREYDVTLGYASTVNGPPIQLDWSYNPEADIYQLDDYELNVRPSPGIRRTKEEMIMTPSQRADLLMRVAGFSLGEIEKGADRARRTAKQRRKTLKTLGRQPIEEAFENTKRKWNKLLGKRQG